MLNSKYEMPNIVPESQKSEENSFVEKKSMDLATEWE